MQLMRFVLIFSSIGLAAFGQIILKIGMTKNGELNLGLIPLIKAFANPYILLGLFLYGISLILWLVVLSKEQLSFVYPMVAFSYVVVTVLAKFILHEEIPMFRWIGLFLIISGIVCIAKS